MMKKRELGNKVELAHSIMEQLNSDAPLSRILSQIRLLASMNSDPVKVALADILIYGLEKVPYQKPPFKDPAYKSAVMEYMKLGSTEDFSDKTVNGVIASLRKGVHRDSIPEQTQVISLSVYEMETHQPPPSPVFGTENEMYDILLRQKLAYEEIKACLIRVRAYMHDYVSRIWTEATGDTEHEKLDTGSTISNASIKIEGKDLEEIIAELKSGISPEAPIAVRESLATFKTDYPDAKKVAFIMMQFGKRQAHRQIEKAIKGELASHGIKGVRADDKQYHDDLYYNVVTYLRGCGFGIAVFEHIEGEKFNPNVSLEVGYMFALKKEVCLLKDNTLQILQSDLVGKLYKDFDPKQPTKTIPPKIKKWLSDKGIG
jgi:hypothetical protein